MVVHAKGGSDTPVLVALVPLTVMRACHIASVRVWAYVNEYEWCVCVYVCTCVRVRERECVCVRARVALCVTERNRVGV